MEFANNVHSVHSLLRRDRSTTPSAKDSPPVAESANEHEYEAVTYGRVGAHPQLMVSFRKSNGTIKVRPFSLLHAIDTEEGNSDLRLDFPDVCIFIRGRNLAKLLEYLTMHRVSEIVEADSATQFTIPESECVVESLEFRKTSMRR